MDETVGAPTLLQLLDVQATMIAKSDPDKSFSKVDDCFLESEGLPWPFGPPNIGVTNVKAPHAFPTGPGQKRRAIGKG